MYINIYLLFFGGPRLLVKIQNKTSKQEFKHINVLAMVGVVLNQQNSYILLEKMSGCFLDLLRESILSYKDILDKVMQVAAGMEYIHFQNILHCDLAARNVLISPSGVLKISDFGMARLDGSEDCDLRGKMVSFWLMVEMQYIWNDTHTHTRTHTYTPSSSKKSQKNTRTHTRRRSSQSAGPHPKCLKTLFLPNPQMYGRTVCCSTSLSRQAMCLIPPWQTRFVWWLKKLCWNCFVVKRSFFIIFYYYYSHIS